jgi:hypothetical protein
MAAPFLRRDASFHVCDVVILLLLVATMMCAQRSVVAACHEAMLWRRHGHTKTWARNIVDGVRQAGEVLVAGFWGEILIKRVEMVLLAIEFVLLVVTQRLAVSAGLMCATMSNEFN